ncbi:hypothetical protein V8E55_010774 [Tylopilus felleus]
MSDAPYVLHTWPSKWSLQSLEPACLAAVMYLQLTIPGKFKVAPTTNPNTSPNGQLPCLTHGHVVVATFPSIVAFVATLAKSHASRAVDLDASLTNVQRLQKTAMYSHIEICVADLVSHMLYGVDINSWKLMNPELASEMPVPLKYCAASSIREAYRPRLEGAGLCSLPSENKGLFDTDKKNKADYRASFSRAFEKEKIIHKVRSALVTHSSCLDGKEFLFGDRPTSLDVYLAAHILLLADPPFPDDVIQIELTEHYQELIDHARRVQAEATRAPPYAYELVTASQTSPSSLVPHPFSGDHAQALVGPEDNRDRIKSLVLIATTLAATAVNIYAQTFLTGGSDKDSEGDDGEGEEEEGLESGSGMFTSVDEEAIRRWQEGIRLP